MKQASYMTVCCNTISLFSWNLVPFVVKTRLDGINKSIEEAAMDLGATPWQTFGKVTLPDAF